MANPNKNQETTSKPPPNPKNPTTNSCTSSDSEETNPPPPPKPHLSIDDSALHSSEFLTREEVLRRRSRRVNQLARYYRTQYWTLMEEVRAKYREYYWKYGKSPFQEEEGEESRRGLGFGGGNCNGNGMRMCSFSGCESKAMELTSYCHSHILHDSKQKLYKACSYVLKRFEDQSLPFFGVF